MAAKTNRIGLPLQVYVEDRPAALGIGHGNLYLEIEPTWPERCGIHVIDAIGGAHDEDTF